MYHFVEEQIKKAVDDGDFDDLPGKGEQLDLRDEFAGLPEEVKQSFRILKRAGYLSDEQENQKQYISYRDLMRIATDGKKQADQSEKQEAFRTLTKERKLDKSNIFHKYAKKIRHKLFQSSRGKS
ncbi:DnaJ family domain-containing protein [Oceanobacillus jeddahense]|uniref:DnaJ family domain-containing protein n=1 Tax=Oceanobacillus jeddahense TaxID=1462527 RepID=UPI00362DB707